MPKTEPKWEPKSEPKWEECPFTGELWPVYTEAEKAEWQRMMQIKEERRRAREAAGICRHDQLWYRCELCD